jgi:hypothetical protein
MARVLAAKLTELLEFELIRRLLFILGRRIIATFALSTIQTHDDSHFTTS